MLNPKYILRDVAGETLLISLQDISAPKRIICLNELGKEIYLLLQQGLDKAQITAKLLEDYDVQEDVLLSDINEFYSILMKYDILLEA